MNKKIIVGLGYKQQTGKDTSADYLVNNYNFTKFSFAHPLKEACSILFNIPIEKFYDAIEKEIVVPEWGYSPRVLLQKTGTDFCRNHIHNDIWIKHMQSRINNAPNNLFVIPDVRFPNECDFIEQNNGLLIKIERDNRYSSSDHISENILNNRKFHHTIYNNFTFEILYQTLDILINDHIKKEK